MRFVNLKIPGDAAWEVREFYKKTVIPTLRSTEGCLFASLMQPTVEVDECVSMTVWASQEHAKAYEESGVYDRLLDEGDDAIAEGTEWEAQLTGDRDGGPPPLYDPEVEGYPVNVAGGTTLLEGEDSRRLYLRIVAVRIDPDRIQELRQRYDQEVAPALLETLGCRAAFLVEGVKSRSRALSVTIWDSEEHAVRYELSGRFDELVAKISEFFSGLYQWKLSLSSGGGGQVGNAGLDVSGYNIVTGSQLRSDGDG